MKGLSLSRTRMITQRLSPAQVQQMTGACTPGLSRSTTYLLTAVLVVTLLAHGLAVAQVLCLLGAVVLTTLTTTSPTPSAFLAAVWAPLARHILTRAAAGV